ncbi:hypothetical protein HZH66_013883 [Vespula vulgaris]|uniref:RRM domain-containing protein n=1 Tax=Vespula vulgaris TaxID=7454 RepID=A0A834J4B7_VESVU|nr:hypothetical protein HZH66_013883 [Vespula vulgaris]
MSRYREWEISCKVYIGNLGSSASKHEIESAFSKYGPLRNVWVARNPPGFAFVEFEDPRDAEDAVRGLDGTRCCGTKVKVEMSTGRRRHSGGGRRPGPRYSSHFKAAADGYVSHQVGIMVNCLNNGINERSTGFNDLPLCTADEPIIFFLSCLNIGMQIEHEQDLRTIYLFDKFIGPDLAVLVGNLWVVIQGKIFIASLLTVFRCKSWSRSPRRSPINRYSRSRSRSPRRRSLTRSRSRDRRSRSDSRDRR